MKELKMTDDFFEDFSEKEKLFLDRYMTNTNSNIFALKNLPEVIKGALFSRYSRSNLGLRSLFLKEFVSNTDESSFNHIVGNNENNDPHVQQAAIKKAQNFYDRILDGYGDDSIGELGGAHLALENISILGAKAIEDCRIGGSPLEKSTRYIYFDQKVNGEYLFYREPVLMTSAYRSLYINTCNMLFDTYSRLIQELTPLFEKKMPKDPASSQAAYSAALRAKVLDCVRGLLPAGTLTSMGVYGNGRFFDHLIHKLHCHNLTEMQDMGKKTYEELAKIIPSFVRRADLSHRTHQSYTAFNENILTDIKNCAALYATKSHKEAFHSEPEVKLVSSGPDNVSRVVAALLFPYLNESLEHLEDLSQKMSDEEISRILEAAANSRENRRHKSPRALERAEFTFEILADFGAYRDLHRHRLLTQERQLLNCNYGFYIPPEIQDTPFEQEFSDAMLRAKEAFDTMASSLKEEAQYVVPMGYNVRWYFHLNLRALQWITELRSSPAGHPTYRIVAQEMAKETIKAFPQFERFFKFVDYSDHTLGRLTQEENKFKKQKALSNEVLS